MRLLGFSLSLAIAMRNAVTKQGQLGQEGGSRMMEATMPL
jgi:hypothetical protein